MFRCVETALEPDPSFPADLKELGFYINKTGGIRMIDAPEKQYVYHATNNERVNEVRREAMQNCQRKEAEKRLSYLGINRIHLPKCGISKPNGPHVPVLSPSLDLLKSRKRVIVIVNDTLQDLGILAYRQLQRELGINGGSVVNFVKEIVKRSAPDNTTEECADIFRDGFELDDNSTTPALIVLNTGQLLYSHKYDQAMTLRSWSSMPRKSVTHEMIRIHDEENHVPGHRTADEHIKTVFDDFICNPERVAADAEVYVIAIEDGTQRVLSLIADDFEKYGSRITAMALVDSLVSDPEIKNPHVRAFLRQRSRQWKFSELTSNPLHCINLPDDYNQDIASSLPSDTSPPMHSAKHISWHEDIPKGPVATITKALHHLALTTTANKTSEPAPPAEPDSPVEWGSGQAVFCPTFAGGEIPVGECIFTNPTVQHAILSFFEEVAQDPENYRNPSCLRTFTKAPQPTPDNPLTLDPSDAGINSAPTSSPMSPEQSALNDASDKLIELRAELAACPTDVPELEKGRKKLEIKIFNLELQVEDLKKDALRRSGLVAGEAKEKRESWKQKIEGPKVPFAGTMVDSDLLKVAGLIPGGVETKLEEGKGGDHEKAFL